MKNLPLWFWVALLVTVLVLFVGGSIVQENKCESAGGHLVSVYRGSICVSEDGKVIEP